MKVGTRIKIIECRSGCKGAEHQNGTVTNDQSNNGLFKTDPGYNVKLDNGSVWRINPDAVVEIIEEPNDRFIPVDLFMQKAHLLSDMSDDGVGSKYLVIPAKDFDYIVDHSMSPIKHGKWINCMNGNATCSECRIRQKDVYDFDNEQHYCGHCGAKMDGGEYE